MGTERKNYYHAGRENRKLFNSITGSNVNSSLRSQSLVLGLELLIPVLGYHKIVFQRYGQEWIQCVMNECSHLIHYDES